MATNTQLLIGMIVVVGIGYAISQSGSGKASKIITSDDYPGIDMDIQKTLDEIADLEDMKSPKKSKISEEARLLVKKYDQFGQEHGQLSFEYNYSNGKIDGLCRDWKYNGQLFMETEYKDGVFISEKCIDDSGDIIDCSIYLNKFSPIEEHYNPFRTSRHSECCDEENNSFL